MLHAWNVIGMYRWCPAALGRGTWFTEMFKIPPSTSAGRDVETVPYPFVTSPVTFLLAHESSLNAKPIQLRRKK